MATNQPTATLPNGTIACPDCGQSVLAHLVATHRLTACPGPVPVAAHPAAGHTLNCWASGRYTRCDGWC